MDKTRLTHVLVLILLGVLALAGCGRIQVSVERPTPTPVALVPTTGPVTMATSTSIPEPTKEPLAISTPIGQSTETPTQPPTPTMPTPVSSLKGRVLFRDEDALYIMNVDGSGKKKLADGVRQYHLSPDRTKVALVVAGADWQAVEPVYDLYTMNVDGTGRTKLSENINVKSFEVISPVHGAVDWSSDSTRLAFAVRDGGVYIIDANGGNRVQLAEYGRNAVWSPDGRRIAYTQDRDLWIADGDGANSHQLVRSRGHGYVPTPTGVWVEEWSPNSQWILYFDFEPPFVNSGWFYIINAKGGEPTRTGGFPIYWSPDRERIAFVDAERVLWVAKPDGSNAVKIAENVSRIYYRVIWSSEGARIAWVTKRKDSIIAEDVFVAQADGSSQIKVNSEHLQMLSPNLNWSPEGQHLIFWWPEEGMYLARADGSFSVKLHDTGDCPVWLAGGEALAFGAEDGFYLAVAEMQWEPVLVHEDWSLNYSDCQWIDGK